MLASMAGSDFVRNPGDFCDIEGDEADRLIAAGFAEKATKAEATAKKKKAANETETAATR